jgi:hypothetical protein
MKIINAFWEKENLGVDVIEIVCSSNDCGDKLETELNRISVPYSVLKIPTDNYNLLCTGQKCGYSVIEVAFKLAGDVRNTKLPSMYNRFVPHLRVETAVKEIREKVLDEIAEGAIFSTDRIALDPIFSKKLAGKRYYNWCCDAINKGASLEVAFYKDTPVAFNINSQPDTKQICYGLLGGVFGEAMDRGLGFLVLYTELESCRRLGGKTVISTVSSNNLPILRLHIQYGFHIKEMNYVLIKHQ